MLSQYWKGSQYKGDMNKVDDLLILRSRPPTEAINNSKTSHGDYLPMKGNWREYLHIHKFMYFK